MIDFEYTKHELSDGREWLVAKATIDFSSKEYSRAIRQATDKSKHTMAANQAGHERSATIKFNKQLMGTLSEMCVKRFLEERILHNDLNRKWIVIRYDDVRTDGFTSSENEYDIKVVSVTDNSKYYKIESRSSIVSDRHLVKAIESYHVIGAYSSSAKHVEDINDFYILPLHYYTGNDKYFPSQYKLRLEQGHIDIFLVAGCNYEALSTKGQIKNLQQEGTQFRVIRASAALDLKSFSREFISVLKSS